MAAMPSPRKLREPVGEVAEGGAARNGNQAEGRHGDARLGVNRIQQEHQAGSRLSALREETGSGGARGAA
jgi:hypothetical protein